MSEAIFDFENEVIQSSFTLPVLVDFWAPWCAPCRMLGPVLEKLAESQADRFRLVKINTEESPDIAARFNVRSIPDVKLFVHGQVADQFSGALPESAILAWLDKALPNPATHQVAEARRLLANGDTMGAAALLMGVLKADPSHPEALVCTARIQLQQAPERIIPALAAIGPDSDFHAEAEALRALSRLVQLCGAPENLPDDPARADYLAAAAHLKATDYGAALDGFIALVKTARRYDDDGARKACVAIFKLLGEDHPLTREYRGRLSSALYA